MLAVTENAVAVICDLTSQQTAPAGSGLRIAAGSQTDALTVSLAPRPEAGDQVVDAAGARLFLDPGAATLLDDKALDAVVDDSGSIGFAVSDKTV